MPTQNRRVATYLPLYIDTPFKDFKVKREIKGDSEALIAILSEFFQVTQEVAYPSSSNLLQRIEAIEERLGRLKSELLSELKNELQVSRTELNKKKSSSKSELQRELLIPNETPSTEFVFKPASKPEGDSQKFKDQLQEITPMTGHALSERFGLQKDTVAKKKSKSRNKIGSFQEWSKSKDKDGITWEYHEEDKLYHPILN